MKHLSIFLQSDAGLDEVGAVLSRIVGHTLTKEESDVGTIYRTRTFCTELSLVDEHGLDDDCGISFTAFDLQLELIPLRAGMEVAEFAPMYEGICRFLASKLCVEIGCRVLVVENLQHVIASFDPNASNCLNK